MMLDKNKDSAGPKLYMLCDDTDESERMPRPEFSPEQKRKIAEAEARIERKYGFSSKPSRPHRRKKKH